MIIRKTIVTVGIIYYMPCYANLLNSFYWQTEDDVPDLVRTHKFLQYWKDNIDAVIRDVLVSYTDRTPEWKRIDWDYRL
jgi:uncharacterized protein Usg